jgi:hypothetical protein
VKWSRGIVHRGEHEPIVDAALFEAVQTKLAASATAGNCVSRVHRQSLRAFAALVREKAGALMISPDSRQVRRSEDDNLMHPSALLSYDHTSFARPGLDRE